MVNRRGAPKLFGRGWDAKDDDMKTMWLVAIILSSIGLALPSTPAAAQTSAGSQAAASQRSASRKKKVKKYDPAVLVVVTNFGKADVKVNGLAYPEYAGESAEPGMVVPAGGPYRVEVTYNGNTRVYTIYLKANRSEEHTSELQSRPHLVC